MREEPPDMDEAHRGGNLGGRVKEKGGGDPERVSRPVALSSTKRRKKRGLVRAKVEEEKKKSL